MKKKESIEIDRILIDFPENVGKLIKESLDSKDYRKKINARRTLVKMGKKILPHMYSLLDSENNLLRMEAAKIVELIAERSSIPILINYLDDKEFEVRWMAAEGLIRIGRTSILPLLKSIRDGKSSFIHNKGAHHILLSLLSDKEKEKVKPLIRSLDDYHELGETAPVEASNAIIILYRKKT
jgi:HEAT repeat protein